MGVLQQLGGGISKTYKRGTGQAPGSLSPEEKLLGFGNSRAREAEAEQRSLRDQWRAKGEEIEKGLTQADADLTAQMQGASGAYKSNLQASGQARDTDLAALKQEIGDSQKDARTTYSNTIQPQMKDMMERSRKEAGYGADATSQPMTLSQSMDPNNAVAQANRKLYETQAQGEGRQGLADVGTLQALGMQNMAGQLGNVPMTGGQMQALMGANSAQSGAAYAQTQRRMQDLRDQGLSRGYEETDKAYGRGIEAQDRYRRGVGDYESAADRQSARDRDYRGEWGDVSRTQYDTNRQYGEDMFNMDSGMAGLGRDITYGRGSREEARANRYYGGSIEGQQAKATRAQAENAKKQDMLMGGVSGLMRFAGGRGGGGGSGIGGGFPGGTQQEQEDQPKDEAQDYTPEGGDYEAGYNPSDEYGGPSGYSSPGAEGSASYPPADRNANTADQGFGLAEQMNPRRRPRRR
jgi:hypothetical protein